MIRTQVQLKEDQWQWLKQKSREKGVSVSQLIREGVELLKVLESRPSETQKQRALKLVGRFSSGISDVSKRHDEYLAEAYK